jgi:CheY-like chemotaxis protein
MKKQLKILLVEDDIIEFMKLERIIKKLNLKHNIVQAENVIAAQEYLKRMSSELPNLILLDLNMPGISGIEFLSMLKKDDVLKCIPVVVLTTSDNVKDINDCLKIGVAGYFIKPLKYDDYFKKIESLLSYWSMNEFVKVNIQKLP